MRAYLLSVSIGCLVAFEAELSASSSLDEDDMSPGIVQIKTKQGTTLKFSTKNRPRIKRTHGSVERTCDNTT